MLVAMAGSYSDWDTCMEYHKKIDGACHIHTIGDTDVDTDWILEFNSPLKTITFYLI